MEHPKTNPIAILKKKNRAELAALANFNIRIYIKIHIYIKKCKTLISPVKIKNFADKYSITPHYPEIYYVCCAIRRLIIM